MHDTALDKNHRRCFAVPTACAGYAVHDPKGRTLGRVKDVYVNEDYEPEYVEVSVGLLGFREALIPVLDVAVDDKRRVLTLQ